MGTRAVRRLGSIESAYGRKVYYRNIKKREELQWKNKSVHSEHKNLQTEYRYKINEKK